MKRSAQRDLLVACWMLFDDVFSGNKARALPLPSNPGRPVPRATVTAQAKRTLAAKPRRRT